MHVSCVSIKETFLRISLAIIHLISQMLQNIYESLLPIVSLYPSCVNGNGWFFRAPHTTSTTYSYLTGFFFHIAHRMRHVVYKLYINLPCNCWIALLISLSLTIPSLNPHKNTFSFDWLTEKGRMLSLCLAHITSWLG